MSNRFKKSHEKGLKFQTACLPYLRQIAEEIDAFLLTDKQYLPEGEYRFDNLRFPDMILIEKKEPFYRSFIEAKRKHGWPDSNGNIYVTVEKKYIDDYLALKERFGARLGILMYCDRTKKAYWISDFSNLTEHVFDNGYSSKKDEISYLFLIDKLEEVPELRGCC